MTVITNKDYQRVLNNYMNTQNKKFVGMVPNMQIQKFCQQLDILMKLNTKQQKWLKMENLYIKLILMKTQKKIKYTIKLSEYY